MNSKLVSVLSIVFLVLFISGCERHKKQWQLERKITLPEESRPLALAKDRDVIWFTDPDYFRLYKIDLNGKVLDSITGIQRPMNIHFEKGTLYIPEFLTDSIWKYKNSRLSPMKINKTPQAPAGVSVYGDTILVADFYNHRIIVETPNKSFTIGKQGHKDGKLYYPIDVKMKNGKVYVADAYNHRIQIFDFEGNHIATIGQNEKINVASGIALNVNELAITDQENSRVLIFDHQGQLLQILTENIVYPTDVLFDRNKLYITNFKENSILIWSLR
ncbi:MAG: NHL repeat-containing protein [Allomuricauda sp.]|jgi:sugar lactone lactonase YvrE|uniref:NHL repeat-containing protein n=1 Tax=Maribacter flavus TaxID=1658664 RepID=A0ABU7IKI4_9FLAO|nr:MULTISPECIES: NHL repeat-containing protein [Flavobacteriaceae]MDC6406352.1 NHL repeat-containing protein [Maribacter sp. PR66]MEE1973472.1 NHL repeat-containing protein [Maribacter flavus]NDV17548.1 hypothetical protein [Muricauda sp. TY007]